MDPSSIDAKPHNLSTSPPPPGSPMPPAASLGSVSSEAEGLDDEESSSRPKSTTQPIIATPPPEIEAVLTSLTSHKNVTGCLILSRPEALIIRVGGKDFEPSGPGAHDRSERLRKVVRLVKSTMETLTKGVGEMDSDDDLGFIRIRTKKYEMMISPSE